MRPPSLTGPPAGAPGQWSGYISSLVAQQSETELGPVFYPEDDLTRALRLSGARHGVVQVNGDRRTWKRLLSHRVQDQNLQGEPRLCRDQSKFWIKKKPGYKSTTNARLVIMLIKATLPSA